MPIIADTARHIANRVAIVQMHEEQLPGSHLSSLSFVFTKLYGQMTPRRSNSSSGVWNRKADELDIYALGEVIGNRIKTTLLAQR